MTGYNCDCLNAKSIVSKGNELNIMVEYNIAELGMTGYVMFRKGRKGRRGGGVILYIKESINAFEHT